MADSFLTRDAVIFISKNAESLPADPGATYNAAIAGTTANYLRILTTARSFPHPFLITLSDLDKLGHGSEFETDIRPDYWRQPVMTIADDANVENMALMLVRAFSGAVTSGLPAFMPDGTTVCPAGGAQEHLLTIKNSSQGRQLLSFNVAVQVGYKSDVAQGSDFRYTGCVVDSFSISQQQGQAPQWSAEIVGSGKHITPSGFVLAAGATQRPNLVNQRYIHSASIGLVYSTDLGTVDLATAGVVKAWAFQWNNNVRRDDRRIGDPFRATNDPTSGAYTNHTERGRRSCTFTVTVDLPSDLSYHVMNRDNKLVSNIILTMRGNLIAGSGAYAALSGAVPRHNDTVELTLPRSKVSGIELGDDNEVQTVQLSFSILNPDQAIQYVTGRILNSHTSYYPTFV